MDLHRSSGLLWAGYNKFNVTSKPDQVLDIRSFTKTKLINCDPDEWGWTGLLWTLEHELIWLTADHQLQALSPSVASHCTRNSSHLSSLSGTSRILWIKCPVMTENKHSQALLLALHIPSKLHCSTKHWIGNPHTSQSSKIIQSRENKFIWKLTTAIYLDLYKT